MESSTNPKEILYLVVSLLFQQVKNLIVLFVEDDNDIGTTTNAATASSTTNIKKSNSKDHHCYLNLLCQERKIDKTVSMALHGLKDKLLLLKDDDASLSPPSSDDHYALVQVVKECGLCRDIGKHKIPNIEEILSRK